MSNAFRPNNEKIIYRNRRWYRFLLFFILPCLLCRTLASCQAKADAGALEVLEAMMAAESSAAGNVYVVPNSPSAEQLLNTSTQGVARARIASDALLIAAFGESELSNEDNNFSSHLCTLVDDGALRFSTGNVPCEYVVFHCISRSDTEHVSALLLERKEALRRQYRDGEYAPTVQQAQVAVIGKYVVFALCDDVETALDAAASAIAKS